MEKLYYKEYYKLEREHWWFKARLKILDNIISKQMQDQSTQKILNAGAATGATSIMLKQYGEVLSLEYDDDCSTFLSEILKEEILNASLTALPLINNTFDLVCAFDVIEHIEDHDKAIKEINRVLQDDGYVFLTVPAFNILWSEHDEINHHFRRYRLKELHELLQGNGFKIEYSSYFNFILFLPILIVRLISKLIPRKKNTKSTGSDFEKFSTNKWLNQLLYKIFESELFLLKRNIKLPFGVSAMILAKKISNTESKSDKPLDTI